MSERSTVWLVRHAAAGDRERWHGPDELRPLSDRGLRQASRLLDVLRPHGVARARTVLSSQYVRCRQTVEPLALELGLAVEEAAELAEGSAGDAALELAARSGDAVLCSHGDVIAEALATLERRGVDLGPTPRLAKGSTWLLTMVGGRARSAEYVPPPL